MSLLVTILSNYFGFADSTISIFNIVMGLTAVAVGAFVLEKLTFKNDYVNVGIKFGGRFLFYLLAVILNNKIVFLATFLYVLLFSESYANVSDGQFINRFDDQYQLAFCNLKEMIGYLGRAIGTFLCGIFVVIDIRFNFCVACIFVLLQLLFICLAIHFKKKEEK